METKPPARALSRAHAPPRRELGRLLARPHGHRAAAPPLLPRAQAGPRASPGRRGDPGLQPPQLPRPLRDRHVHPPPHLLRGQARAVPPSAGGLVSQLHGSLSGPQGRGRRGVRGDRAGASRSRPGGGDLPGGHSHPPRVALAAQAGRRAAGAGDGRARGAGRGQGQRARPAGMALCAGEGSHPLRRARDLPDRAGALHVPRARGDGADLALRRAAVGVAGRPAAASHRRRGGSRLDGHRAGRRARTVGPRRPAGLPDPGAGRAPGHRTRELGPPARGEPPGHHGDDRAADRAGRGGPGGVQRPLCQPARGGRGSGGEDRRAVGGAGGLQGSRSPARQPALRLRLRAHTRSCGRRPGRPGAGPRGRRAGSVGGGGQPRWRPAAPTSGRARRRRLHRRAHRGRDGRRARRLRAQRRHPRLRGRRPARDRPRRSGGGPRLLRGPRACAGPWRTQRDLRRPGRDGRPGGRACWPATLPGAATSGRPRPSPTPRCRCSAWPSSASGSPRR